MSRLADREFPFPVLTLAADARLSRTDYTDDQVWELRVGSGDAPGLALHTRYGARTGLASLVPMWMFKTDRRIVYQPQAYATLPKITGYAPNFARIEGAIVPGLTMLAEFWVMESHAIGGRYTLSNQTDAPINIRLDLFAQVASEGKTQKLAILTLGDQTSALSFGAIGALHPAVMLAGATADLTSSSPKIGADLSVPAGGSAAVKFVHAALDDLRDSLALARNWLDQDWDSHFTQIARAAQAIPQVTTGDREIDGFIAASYQHLLQAYLRPGVSLPHAILVGTRQPASGFSPNGDGTDHDRSWSGATPTWAYLASLGVATIDRSLAESAIRNFLAVQQADGAIDGKPGAAGQRADWLGMPLLARLALELFRYTEDEGFLRETLPKLLKFYQRWFAQDTDGDGAPEWVNERQMGYPFFPMFGLNQPWAQNLDIRCVEGPDLLAYLLSEGISLRELARHLGDTTLEETAYARVAPLQTRLNDLWNNGRYSYRDRDTHQLNAPAIPLIHEGTADESQVIAQELTHPARLLIRIQGGTGKTPKLGITAFGNNPQGQAIREQVDQGAWYRGYGVYVTRQVFKFVDRVEVTGLSRVYKIQVSTPDFSKLDISALLPLWSRGITVDRSKELISLMQTEFLRANGITMTPISEDAPDPTHDQGGAIWPFWLSLIGEGLWEYGYTAEAHDLLLRMLRAQSAVYKHEAHVKEFYFGTTLQGSGETGHLSGIAPLHLLTRVLGVRILSAHRVWTGGTFIWNTPITVQQHGVTVTRSAEGTQITFPSGQKITLAPGDDWQGVSDPTPMMTAAPIATPPAPYPDPAPQPSPHKVIIPVEVETAKPVTRVKIETDESDK